MPLEVINDGLDELDIPIYDGSEILKWPGERPLVGDVIAASDDPDDWFPPEYRIKAYRDVTHRVNELWKPNKPGWKPQLTKHQGWGFRFILIAAPMGFGKTALASYYAHYWYYKGHPVFSASKSFLFGNRLIGSEVYRVIERIPLGSVVFLDELHAIAPSKNANSIGVAQLGELMAGLRKKRCILVGASAKPAEIARAILDMVSEVWIPDPIRFLAKPGNEELVKEWEKGKAFHDPRKFTFAWRVHPDYPVQKHYGSRDRQQTFLSGRIPIGRPTHLGYATDHRFIRRSYALMDTFDPLAAGYSRQFGNRYAMAEEGQEDPVTEANILKMEGILDALQAEGMKNVNEPVFARFMTMQQKDFATFFKLLFPDSSGLKGRNGYKIREVLESLRAAYFGDEDDG